MLSQTDVFKLGIVANTKQLALSKPSSASFLSTSIWREDTKAFVLFMFRARKEMNNPGE